MSLRAVLLICLVNFSVLSMPVLATDDEIPPAPISEEEGLVELYPANLATVDFGGEPGVAYDCCDEGACRHGLCGRFLNLLEPSDRCFEDFISPTSNLLFFEDPRQLTEARFVFLNHRVPDDIFGGWELQTIGLQLRARITDRLSIIATKDGFIMQQPDSIADDGWADVALGLKYSLFRDPERQRLWSVGFTYELPVGSRRALQGNGDGEFHLFLSGGRQIGCHAHWLTGLGIRLPSNHHDRSQMVYWSNHFDYEVVDNIYGFFEVNWFHWTRSGDNALTNGIAGFDLLNLGSTGVAGLDVVTLAAGATMKLRCYDELSLGYEFPVSEEEDIIRDRFYLTYSLRY
ncbi:MAG: hypothetical protein MI757_22475 [Pirellulales bacterium]|nr:hypothetical protein [Pirellulales bacterium]